MKINSVLNAVYHCQSKIPRAWTVLEEVLAKGKVSTLASTDIQAQRIKAHYQPLSGYPIYVDLAGGYGIDIIDMPFNPFVNKKTYTGLNYAVAARIQQLRIQLLIHSRLYYELDRNIWQDKEWDTNAYELVDLQRGYPEDSKRVVYYEAFKTWDATTGCMLPLNDPWVVRKTEELLINRRVP